MITVPHQGGVSCSTTCARTGSWRRCRGAIAIGGARRSKAVSDNAAVANNYHYSCADSQNAYDEVALRGAGTYTSYCCCYR